MQRLGERLARGDPAAFAELYDACADRVHHYLVVRLGSREDADDVVQETFVRLARTRKRLADVEDMIAYTFTVARNEAARLLGREVRRRDVSAGMLFREAAEDNTEASETADLIAVALGRLSEEQREVVELKMYGGLTFREMAEVTDLPQGTLATRYRTAIERLRSWLDRELS